MSLSGGRGGKSMTLSIEKRARVYHCLERVAGK